MPHITDRLRGDFRRQRELIIKPSIKSPRPGTLEPLDTNTEGCDTDGSPERHGGSFKFDLNHKTKLGPLQVSLPKFDENGSRIYEEGDL